MHGVQRCGVYRYRYRCSVVCVCLCVCVCVLDITMNCAKRAEPIDMLFGMWTRMGPRNNALGWASGEGAILGVPCVRCVFSSQFFDQLSYCVA